MATAQYAGDLARRMKGVAVLVVAIGILATTQVSHAVILTRQASGDFDWQYEMGVSPTTQVLDGNLVNDFTPGGSGSTSLFGDVLTYNSLPSSDLYFNGGMDTPGQMWPGKHTLASGFTIETRLRVLQQAGPAAFRVFATPAGTSAAAMFDVGTGGQGWAGSGTSLGTNDNSSGFHTFRIAQEPGSATYSVWRDGLLLSNSLGSGFTHNHDYMWFGDGTGSFSGEVAVDYYRVTSGAYAPPLRMKSSQDFRFRYEFDDDPFDPGQVDLDDNLLADMTSTAAAPSGGILTFQDGQYAQGAGGGRIWDNAGLTALAGFTAEFAVKVVQQTGSEGALAFVMGPADSSTSWTILEIGASSAQWQINNGSSRIVLDTNDNTDGFHVFRIMKEESTNNFYVWRDGVLLSDSLPQSRNLGASFWFGDGGGAYGGISQLDWVRFTPGSFIPAPEPGTVTLMGLGGLLGLMLVRRKCR